MSYSRMHNPAIVVQNAAYANTQAVGGLIEIARAGRNQAGRKSGLIARLQLRAKTASVPTVTINLHVFTQKPVTGVYTDRTNITFASADALLLIKTFTILSTDWVSAKGSSPYATVELVTGLPLYQYDIPGESDLAAGLPVSSLWAVIEAGGAWTPATTDGVAMLIGTETD